MGDDKKVNAAKVTKVTKGAKAMMDIFIDDGIPKDWFFISVPLNAKDSLSFDWTLKGHRMILQRLKGRRSSPDGKPTMEWDTLHIRGGKYIGSERIQWYDLDKKDWVNGKIYETIREWPLKNKTAGELLRYSLIVRGHKTELMKYSKEMQKLENLLGKLITATVAGTS